LATLRGGPSRGKREPGSSGAEEEKGREGEKGRGRSGIGTKRKRGVEREREMGWRDGARVNGYRERGQVFTYFSFVVRSSAKLIV
jgi:hypothetical protein